LLVDARWFRACESGLEGERGAAVDVLLWVIESEAGSEMVDVVEVSVCGDAGLVPEVDSESLALAEQKFVAAEVACASVDG
jgi:hypothetical protein